MIRKDLVVAVLLTFCLTVTLFQIIPTIGQGPGDYDPWYDINDDGKIDMRDIGGMARKFGTSGEPTNKTYLLYYAINLATELNVTFQVRVPQREVISIPAAAFVPEVEFSGDVYGRNRGLSLANSNASHRAYFYAPVQLPHGVKVTRVYSFWYDNGTGSVGLYLSKYNFTYGARLEMVGLESPLEGSPGKGSSNTNIIEESIIDNYSYYYLAVLLPPRPRPKFTDYAFYYAIIEYEYPA